MDRLNTQTRLRRRCPPPPFFKPILAIGRTPTAYPDLTLLQTRRHRENPRVSRL
jgi:hypothetical protein